MAIVLSVNKIGNRKVTILDQNILSSENMTAGQLINIKNGILFWCSGGSIIANVSGTDSKGNTYGYKDETEAGVGNAGYYVNGEKLVAFTPGLGVVKFVYLVKDRNRVHRAFVCSYTNAGGIFVNGTNYNGASFTSTLSWYNLVKVNMLTGSPYNIQVMENRDQSGYIFSTGVGDSFYGQALTLEPIIPDPDNPYDDAGSTRTGGGGGNFSEDSDSLTDDALPDETTTGAVGTGFSTIFTPSKSQLQHLADVMWGNDIVSFLQNQVENIGSMFVSLGIVPFQVTAGATVTVMWLGLVDTAISLTKAANQFYEFDMGSIDLANDSRIHTSGSVFDYSPFSRLGIYLPFIGYQEINIDECRDCVISLKYKVDIMSGSCVAKVFVNGNPLYQFSGNCITQIPLSSQDAQTLFTNAVNVGIAAAGASMTGAVASAGDALSAEKYVAGDISAQAAEYQAGQHAAQVSSAESHLASATANGMMGMKPSYNRSGAISASNSLLALRQPYLFLTTPREAVPEHYQRYCGFPSNITGQLGSFSGFTVVEDIRLNGLVATSSEVEEIYSLLKTGVII